MKCLCESLMVAMMWVNVSFSLAVKGSEWQMVMLRALILHCIYVPRWALGEVIWLWFFVKMRGKKRWSRVIGGEQYSVLE
jgi:hypothetical protein